MSTSSNASKGSPDDDEGRLVDGVSDADEATDADGAADEVDEADEAIEDATGDSEDDASEELEEAVPAAAGARGRSAAQRSSGSGRGKAPVKRAASERKPGPKKEERRGPIAAIALFVRQVISELRKVVTPTGRELGTYVAVVIVFVLIVMAYVGALDFAIGRLVLWAFGG